MSLLGQTLGSVYGVDVDHVQQVSVLEMEEVARFYCVEEQCEEPTDSTKG